MNFYGIGIYGHGACRIFYDLLAIHILLAYSGACRSLQTEHFARFELVRFFQHCIQGQQTIGSKGMDRVDKGSISRFPVIVLAHFFYFIASGKAHCEKEEKG